MDPIWPREEVRSFATIMERKLRKHDDWPGWKDCSAYWLSELLREHVGKLEILIVDLAEPARVAEAAADVANYAMMIADVVGQLDGGAPGEG